MTEEPIYAPASISCAHCGKPLNTLTSYGLSVPVSETRVRPSDFCDLGCLVAWSADVAQLAMGMVRRN